MNLQNQLSIKSALRFALPCMASALLFTACSNDDSEPTPGGSDNVTAGTIRFSASAPLASEDVTTRIGIDNEKKPTVDEHTAPEPVIWLGGEEISVFFVPDGGGAEIHAKFKIDSESLSSDRKSADLLNITDLSGLDGEYTIYAFTPYVATNTLDQAQLNLSNQIQEPNTTTYSHLGNTASMRASGGTVEFDNGSLTSNANFHFEHITSFLRFNITNGLGEDITVRGITLSHPNLRSNATYSIEYNDLTHGTPGNISIGFGMYDQLLANNTALDVYMSTFPISNASEFNEKLEITLYIVGKDPFVYEVFPSELGFTQNQYMFETATRFMLNLTLENESSPLTSFNTVVHKNIKYTTAFYHDHSSNITINELVYMTADILINSCPSGWSFFDQSDVPQDASERNALHNSLLPICNTYYNAYLGQVIHSTDEILILTTNDKSEFREWLYGYAPGVNNGATHRRFRAICYQAID